MGVSDKINTEKYLLSILIDQNDNIFDGFRILVRRCKMLRYAKGVNSEVTENLSEDNIVQCMKSDNEAPIVS